MKWNPRSPSHRRNITPGITMGTMGDIGQEEDEGEGVIAEATETEETTDEVVLTDIGARGTIGAKEDTTDCSRIVIFGCLATNDSLKCTLRSIHDMARDDKLAIYFTAGRVRAGIPGPDFLGAEPSQEDMQAKVPLGSRSQIRLQAAWIRTQTMDWGAQGWAAPVCTYRTPLEHSSPDLGRWCRRSGSTPETNKPWLRAAGGLTRIFCFDFSSGSGKQVSASAGCACAGLVSAV